MQKYAKPTSDGKLFLDVFDVIKDHGFKSDELRAARRETFVQFTSKSAVRLLLAELSKHEKTEFLKRDLEVIHVFNVWVKAVYRVSEQFRLVFGLFEGKFITEVFQGVTLESLVILAVEADSKNPEDAVYAAFMVEYIAQTKKTVSDGAVMSRCFVLAMAAFLNTPGGKKALQEYELTQDEEESPD